MTRLTSISAVLLAVVAACHVNDKSKSKPATPAEPPPPATPAGPTVIEVEGFSTPESVLYDADADVYLVSNINGSPLEADGNGFISRVSPDGSIAELKWIDGAAEGVTLSAPKGMALLGDKLYVTDITAVRIFDRGTGAPAGEIAIEGATFLNDMVSDADVVYVSDSGLTTGFKPSGTDAVYAIAADGVPTKLIGSAELGAPNGLVADEAGVWVVTFGSGEIYHVVDGERQRAQKLPKGQLDGIVVLPDGRLLISSWEGQSVFAGPPDGPFEEVVTGVESPADIGYDSKRNRLLIPLFQRDVVQIHPL